MYCTISLLRLWVDLFIWQLISMMICPIVHEMKKAIDSDEKKVTQKQGVIDQCVELRHEVFRSAKLENIYVPTLKGNYFDPLHSLLTSCRWDMIRLM
jgi:hypothetical protein